jgi:hypothetical protein
MLRVVVSFILTALVVAHAIDYCDEKLCRPGRKHVGCGHSHRFARDCPRGVNIIDMLDREFKEAIVREHNAARNKVALADGTGLRGAARMLTVVSIGGLFRMN